MVLSKPSGRLLPPMSEVAISRGTISIGASTPPPFGAEQVMEPSTASPYSAQTFAHCFQFRRLILGLSAQCDAASIGRSSKPRVHPLSIRNPADTEGFPQHLRATCDNHGRKDTGPAPHTLCPARSAHQ